MVANFGRPIPEYCSSFYSYPRVNIADKRFLLNVSGGTTWDEQTKISGWQDLVRQGSQIIANQSIRNLKLLLDHSLPLDQVRNFEQKPPFQPLQNKETYFSLLAQQIVPNLLNVGNKVVVAQQQYTIRNGGRYWENATPPKKRYLIGENNGYNYKINFSQIDWSATAKINKIDLPEPIEYLRV